MIRKQTDQVDDSISFKDKCLLVLMVVSVGYFGSRFMIFLIETVWGIN